MRYLLFGLVFLFTVACTILGLVLRLALPALAGPMKALYALLMATAVARFVLGIRPGSPAEDEAPAASSLEETLARLQKLRKRGLISALMTIFHGLALAACSAAFESAVFYAGLQIIYLSLVEAGLFRLPFWPADQKQGPVLLPAADFPILYELLERAKAEAGISEDIRLFLSASLSSAPPAGIALSPVQLSAFSKDEMFAFLLKSCAAWAAETPEMRRERAHHGWLTARSNPLLGFLFPYSRADIQYEREFPAFDATCRRLGDQAAEAAIARHPRETADLIVKLAYLRLWDWECFPCDAPPHSFREALPARRETWNDLIQRELPDLDGRPTALQRLHALGCSRLPDAVSLPEGDHARECQRAAALAPRFPATDYEKELVSRWEKKGKPFSDHDYEEFLDVLLRTGRADEALAFCERAISLLPAQERAEARFTRGLLLLHRWDEKGLDDLTAILDDLYDRETALRLACDFCTLTGRAERRAEIWERSRSVLTGRI